MRVSNFHLCIGIPLSFPTVPASFFHSFVHMERPSFTYIHADNGSIDDLRNNIVNQALDLNATSLMMMDTDQVYHPKTIPTLLKHKLPIVGALVHRRYPPFDSLMLKKVQEGNVIEYQSIDDYETDSLVEVDATGAGCLMFDMAVFREMPAPWFKTKRNPDGTTLGEDIGFCQDLKEAGYRIFVDTSVPAGHLTTLCVNRQTNLLYRSMKQKEQQQRLAAALAGASEVKN